IDVLHRHQHHLGLHLLPDVLPVRLRPPPRSTLFPYTTLFRSLLCSSRLMPSQLCCAVCSWRGWLKKAAQVIVPCASGENLLLVRSEEHTSELQSRFDLVCRLLLEKKK